MSPTKPKSTLSKRANELRKNEDIVKYFERKDKANNDYALRKLNREEKKKAEEAKNKSLSSKVFSLFGKSKGGKTSKKSKKSNRKTQKSRW
jgi:hypothetical protein